MSALFFVLVSGWLCLHKMLACPKIFNNLSHNLCKGGSSATMTKCCEWHTSKDMLMLKKLTVLSEQVYTLSYRGFFFANFFINVILHVLETLLQFSWSSQKRMWMIKRTVMQPSVKGGTDSSSVKISTASSLSTLVSYRPSEKGGWQVAHRVWQALE